MKESSKSDSKETEFDEIVPETNVFSSKVTACVIIDNNSSNQIQRCNRVDKNRSICQLIGTWEIDPDALEDVSGEVARLGVCLNHLNFDQNTLHKTDKKEQKIKKLRPTDQSTINKKKCLFCNKYKYFFSRGNACAVHVCEVYNRNLQVPCRGLLDCPSMKEHPVLSQKSSNEYRIRFVCSECYELNGGHLHVRPGSGSSRKSCIDRGQHQNDLTLILKTFGRWLDQVASSDNNSDKIRLINQLLQVLPEYNPESPVEKQTKNADSVQNSGIRSQLPTDLKKHKKKIPATDQAESDIQSQPGTLIQRNDVKEFSGETTEIATEREILPESHSISETLMIKQTKAKYKPSPQEEQILTGLADYQEFLPTSVVKELLGQLCVYSAHWTHKKIRDRWYNKYARKKSKRHSHIMNNDKY
jgi:hypothetical protein